MTSSPPVLICANSLTARFGIENALLDTDDRGAPDLTSTLVITSYAVGVACVPCAARMELAAQSPDPAPDWRWFAFPAVNAATITIGDDPVGDVHNVDHELGPAGRLLR